MVDIDSAVIARHKSGSSSFEILVDCDKAIAFKHGEEIPLEEVLATEKIFSDAGKGLVVSGTELQSAFGTDDPTEVARKILKKGEVQVTAEYRAKQREKKANKIISMIHMNGLDPRTKLPHPLERIKLAFEEAKVKIDEHRKAEDQIDRIIKELRPVLPISIEKKVIEIIIPAEHAGKGYSAVQGFGKMTEEEWLTNGSFRCVLQIPAGLQPDLFDSVNKITHGDVEIKVKE